MIKHFVRRILRALMQCKYFRTWCLALKRKDILPSAVWLRLPVEFQFDVNIPDGRGFSYHSVAYDNIGRYLYWDGWDSLEPGTIPIFYQLAKKAEVILDIGSNTGLYALVACAANKNAKVLAFEPVPNIFQLLKRNIDINGFGEQCDLHQMAISDHNGIAEFSVLTHEVHNVPTSSSLHVQGFRNRRSRIIEVKIATIDAICSNYNDANIDLVKIDVEGFEDRVLRGMKQVIARHQPVIIAECNPDGPYKKIEDTMVKAGYNIYHLTSKGVIPVDQIKPDREERDRNYLFTGDTFSLQNESDFNLSMARGGT